MSNLKVCRLRQALCLLRDLMLESLLPPGHQWSRRTCLEQLVCLLVPIWPSLPLIAKKVNQLDAFGSLQNLSSSDTSVDSEVSASSIQEVETKGPYCDGAPPSAFLGSPTHLQNASPFQPLNVYPL
ncbi:hypothetical protein Nepgr_013444 [Nepenthes gracilis]|uniref:Uncharacterized protein n=1 Tax=Nepenthes gracilis TaxID=150966 RepID=A0AAD3SHU3_NEPGR|nr:hypothetical protein Nepgr_013444 [Nepenthes gracilis]